MILLNNTGPHFLSVCAHLPVTAALTSTSSIINVFLSLSEHIYLTGSLHLFGTVWPFWCWCAVKLWYHSHSLGRSSRCARIDITLDDEEALLLDIVVVVIYWQKPYHHVSVNIWQILAYEHDLKKDYFLEWCLLIWIAFFCAYWDHSDQPSPCIRICYIVHISVLNMRKAVVNDDDWDKYLIQVSY